MYYVKQTKEKKPSGADPAAGLTAPAAGVTAPAAGVTDPAAGVTDLLQE